MDEDTLAPMADALSATLAVIVLLICFFILAQVVAVSKQIDIERVGDSEYVKQEFVIEFENAKIDEGRLKFFKSFNPSKDVETVEKYIDLAVEKCKKCTSFKVLSNYPLVNASVGRAKRRSLANAIKIVPFITKRGMDYEIELANNHNNFFLEVTPIGEK
ncbi:hypothetical protein [Vibrio alginolyticus]|uniref:hypothetical protein n=1 Tax=Vibrio TaxID=662 RepID=UPI0006CA6045|nr:hypothetical protein [Vibrio alginolyticus]KPM98690.1 hypothetical protein AOG25_09825 [Vibrio alginolyticus]CAH7169885.1 conserved hypothetical protein [Vibrio chagasii]CAH7339078.1 conserved hypothetical protein [Vibrio chagasii]